MRFLSFTGSFLFAAYVILLLHNCIPHHHTSAEKELHQHGHHHSHHDENQNEGKGTNKVPADSEHHEQIQKLLGLNSNKSNKSEKMSFSKLFLAASSVHLKVTIPCDHRERIFQQFQPESSWLCQSSSLRAPPVLA